jgi:hypothetical protein
LHKYINVISEGTEDLFYLIQQAKDNIIYHYVDNLGRLLPRLPSNFKKQQLTAILCHIFTKFGCRL